jgi:ethanolamine utilization cobalamin adenosyltransferase
MLRETLKFDQPKQTVYLVPQGTILSPAAQEYLRQRKIKIEPEKEGKETAVLPRIVATEVPPVPTVALPSGGAGQPNYVDGASGAFYLEKPEHMTQLSGHVLVPKNHPRILFRGKLDALQALVVLDQAILAEDGGSQRLIDDLGELLGILREIMRCDVLEETFRNESILGLDHAQLRERSHDPMKFYHIPPMVLPDYTMGKHYALLNQLRTAVRETEAAAVTAFQQGTKDTRKDIVEALNRMSSAAHIMMCRYLSGEYKS